MQTTRVIEFTDEDGFHRTLVESDINDFLQEDLDMIESSLEKVAGYWKEIQWFIRMANAELDDVKTDLDEFFDTLDQTFDPDGGHEDDNIAAKVHAIRDRAAALKENYRYLVRVIPAKRGGITLIDTKIPADQYGYRHVYIGPEFDDEDLNLGYVGDGEITTIEGCEPLPWAVRSCQVGSSSDKRGQKTLPASGQAELDFGSVDAK